MLDSNDSGEQREVSSRWGWLRVHPVTLILTSIAVWGLWNVQTDRYPFNERMLLRPSWFIYGWPICFATSWRGRFNIDSIDYAALIFDLLISLAIIFATLWACERILHFEKLSIRHVFAITGGFAVIFFVWSESFQMLLELIMAAEAPRLDGNAQEGNSRTPERLSPFEIIPISWGLFCVGFGLFDRVFIAAGRMLRPNNS